MPSRREFFSRVMAGTAGAYVLSRGGFETVTALQQQSVPAQRIRRSAVMISLR